MLEVENHQKKLRIRLRIQTSTNLNLLCTAIRSWRISEWLPHLQQAYRQIMEDRQEVGAEIVVLRVKKDGFFIAGSQIVGEIFQDNDQVFCEVAERKNHKKNDQKKSKQGQKNQKNQNQNQNQNQNNLSQKAKNTQNATQITNVVAEILQKKAETLQKEPKSQNSKQKQTKQESSQKRIRPIQQDQQEKPISQSKPKKKQKVEEDPKKETTPNKLQDEKQSPAKDKTQKIADVASLWKKIKEKNGQTETPQSKKSNKYATSEHKIIQEEQQND